MTQSVAQPLPDLASRPSPAVLLGWELGGGLGHVRPLLLVAKALADAGASPILALRDVVSAAPQLRAAGFPVLQAPGARSGREPPGFLAHSYADILAISGFAQVDELLALTEAWQALIDLIRPAAIVADHAPTLCLAAYGCVPTIQASLGFCVPPADGPEFPPLLPDQPSLVPQQQLLSVVQEVQRRRSKPVPPTLSAIFATAGLFVLVIPELDPYQAQRTKPAWGPVHPIGPPLSPPAQPEFFAYLSAEMPGFEMILACLARSGFPGRAFVRGASETVRAELRHLGLDILNGPIPESEILTRATVVVSQGGCGLTQAALGAGRPQFLFPAYLEQLLNARRLHALGVAHFLTGTFPAADVTEGLRQLLIEPRFTLRAQSVAADLQARDRPDPLAAIVAQCRAMFARPNA